MTWSTKKIIACLKSITHEEIMPKVVDSELEKFNGEMNEERVKEFLNFLFEKSENKLKMYGSVEQVMIDLKQSTRVPEFHNYSEYDFFEIGVDCLSTGEIVILTDTKSEEYVYKQQLLLKFVHYVSDNSSKFALRFAQLWVVEMINRKHQEMKGYYEIVPFQMYKNITKQLILASATFSPDSDPDVVVERNDLEVLMRGYCPNFPDYIFDDLMLDLKKETEDMSYSESLKYIKSSYNSIVKMVETVTYVLNLNKNIFLPFTWPEAPLPFYQTPTFLLINDTHGTFAMAKQLDTALRTAFDLVYPGNIYPELIELETEKEREQGMIFCVSESKFIDIMTKLELKTEDLNIIVKNVKLTRQFTLPIISSYGTHCKSPEMAVREILNYMLIFLNVFETDDEDCLEKIFGWIDDNLVDLFPERKFAAYIETWKIKEKLDKACRELKIYKPRKIFKMPQKTSYTKNDIIEIVRHTIKPSCFNATCYDLALRCLNFEGDRTHLPYEMIELFQLYAMNMVIRTRCPKITRMIALQNALRGFSTGLSNSDESQPEKQASSSPKKSPAKISDPKPLKKGFLNGKRLDKSETDENGNDIPTDLFDSTANQLLGTSLQTLAHFSNQEYRPISEFEKVLNDHFRGFFNDRLWNCLKLIFKNKEKLKKLLKCVDHLFDLKFENDQISFKKKKVYDVDPIQRKLIQEIEDEENEKLEKARKMEESQKSNEDHVNEIEKLKDEIEKLKKQDETAQNYEEVIKKMEKRYKDRINSLQRAINEKVNGLMSKDKTIERLEKELRDDKIKIERLEKNKEKLKSKELDESKNKLKELEKVNVALEDSLKKSQRQIANHQEEIRNLKGNMKNRAVELKKLQEQLDSKTEENQKLTTNLDRLNVKIESIHIVEKLKAKNEELGIVTQLKAENLKVRSMIQENSQKYEELEKWFLSGFDVFQRVQQPQDEVNKRLEKYLKITSIDYDDVLDLLGANLNSLAQVYPDSVEIREARKKVLDFDANYEDYIKKVRTQIRIIRENPEIHIDELGKEIEEFPDKQFMEIYEKWVDDNNLLQ